MSRPPGERDQRQEPDDGGADTPFYSPRWTFLDGLGRTIQTPKRT
ncbi:MAG TPA: hypothetical protein VFD70_13085 [Anaerolineae bacterium]|nr:hypothetical protein [Anaerolineae bacterium]